MIRRFIALLLGAALSLQSAHGVTPATLLMGMAGRVISVVSAPTYTLIYDTTGTSTGNQVAVYDSTYNLTGTIVNDTTTRSIGEVDVVMTAVGTISGKNFVVSIWNVSGASLSGTSLGTATVAGNNSWSSTLVPFVFSSPVTTGTDYAITVSVSDGSTSTTNRLTLYYMPSVSAPMTWPSTFGFAWWNTSGGSTDNLGAFNRIQMKIYTSP